MKLKRIYNEFKTILKRIKVPIEKGNKSPKRLEKEYGKKVATWKKKAIPKTTMWNRGQKRNEMVTVMSGFNCLKKEIGKIEL